MDYIAFVNQLKKRGSVPGLDAIRGLLAELSHPEKDLNVIHIAGTNGKGSVFACLSSILIEAGYRVGRYVSPTITCYEERFQINGKFIAKEKLERLYEEVALAMSREEEKGAGAPTLFEAETALAFLYFKEEKVDFALIETGMGGRLDATNVVEQPKLTVISSISYDHKAFLGDTLEKIAWQKAGIIKKGCPVVLAENRPEVCRVIRDEYLKVNGAAESDAGKEEGDAGKKVCNTGKEDGNAGKEDGDIRKESFYPIQKSDYEVLEESPYGSTFLWKGREFSLGLPGRHQISNAVTALLASEVLLLDKTGRQALDRAQRDGLGKTVWPGRLEILQKQPLFYRDGAHNPDGARKLASFLEKHFTNRGIIYIMGVLRDKEYKEMLSYLLPFAKKIYVFRPDNERGLEAGTLADAVTEVSKGRLEPVCCRDVKDAVSQALSGADPDDVLVACGSLSFMEEMEDTF